MESGRCLRRGGGRSERVRYRKKTLSSMIALFIASALSCTPENQEPDRLAAGGFSGLGAATDVAHAKGFFTAEGIRFEFDSVDSSEELMTNLIGGRYDIIQTNADNVIAWTEGQGADGTPHDFVMVLGGYRGREPMELVVAADIRSVDDLRGKVLAVDAVHTGYAPMLVYMLRQEGLVWKVDYELESVGGGPMRIASLKAGKASGGLVELDAELEALGYHVLLTSSDYVAEYARGVTAARRNWAEANADLLVRYIRAMVRAINWLLDPAHRAEAVAIIMAADGVDADEARLRYEEAVNPVYGFVPDGELRPPGIEQILEIREVMGAMSAPLPPPGKYIEDRYYRSAMQSLDR